MKRLQRGRLLPFVQMAAVSIFGTLKASTSGLEEARIGVRRGFMLRLNGLQAASRGRVLCAAAARDSLRQRLPVMSGLRKTAFVEASAHDDWETREYEARS